MIKVKNLTESLENKYNLNESSENLTESYYIDDDCVINSDTNDVDATFTVNINNSDIYFNIIPKRNLSDKEKKSILKKVKSELNWLAKTGSFGNVPFGFGVYGGFNESFSLNESSDNWVKINSMNKYKKVSDNYECDKNGNVRNSKTGRQLTPSSSMGGYFDLKFTVRTNEGKTTSVSQEQLKQDLEDYHVFSKLGEDLKESLVFKAIPADDPSMWGYDSEDEFENDILSNDGQKITGISEVTDGFYDIVLENGITLSAVSEECIVSNNRALNEATESLNRQAAIDLWFKIFDRDSSGMILLHALSKITGIAEDEITANAKEKWEANQDEFFLSSIPTKAIYKSLEEYGADEEYPGLFRKISKPIKKSKLNEDLYNDVSEQVWNKIRDIIENAMDNLTMVIASEVPEYNPDWSFLGDYSTYDTYYGIYADKLADKLTEALMYYCEKE